MLLDGVERAERTEFRGVGGVGGGGGGGLNNCQHYFGVPYYRYSIMGPQNPILVIIKVSTLQTWNPLSAFAHTVEILFEAHETGAICKDSAPPDTQPLGRR